MTENDEVIRGSHESAENGEERGETRREQAERERKEECAREKKAAEGKLSHKEKAAQKKEAARLAKEEEKRRAEEKKAREEEARQKAKEAKERIRREKAERRRIKRRKALHRLKIFLIVLLVLVVVLGVAATVGGYYVTNSNTNLPNVYLDGVNVSKLTKGQTMKALSDAGWDKSLATPLMVLLPADKSFEIDMLESGAMLPKEDAAETAFRYGHGQNWYENLFYYLKGLFVQTDISQKFGVIDEKYLGEQIRAAVEDFKTSTAEGGEYTLDKEKGDIRLIKGAGEMELDEAALLEEIKIALRSEQKELDHQHIDNELVMPDFDAIYKELHVEPVDAKFINEKFEIQEEVVGVDFDVDKAKQLWTDAAPAAEIVIPVKISYPETTAETLEGTLFRDMLGKQTTLFGGSTPERMSNIALAVRKLNGVIVYPGETFSYNETVGERTREAGFKEAGAYQDGEVVQEIGGGVCQVSSTLYCAALFANMETVEREAHYFMVNYLPWAHDATVSWPSPDFKFKNTREYPVMIRAWADIENALDLTIEIWGTDVDGSYVELEYERYMIFADGTDTVVGWHVYSHRNVYDKDGNLIATVDEPDGIYHKHAEDIGH